MAARGKNSGKESLRGPRACRVGMKLTDGGAGLQGCAQSPTHPSMQSSESSAGQAGCQAWRARHAPDTGPAFTVLT